MPDIAEDNFKELLWERFHTYAGEKTTTEAMVGLFNRKLADVLLKEAGIELQKKAAAVSKEQLQQLSEKCKRMTVHVKAGRSFEQAQVCAGGVFTKDIDNETMESKLVSNVYFAGEVVDIDGTCGGYNLQWAWSSGYVAGYHAALNR